MDGLVNKTFGVFFYGGYNSNSCDADTTRNTSCTGIILSYLYIHGYSFNHRFYEVDIYEKEG
jgi:hypothetical protein